MKINISDEMARAVICALRMHVERRGEQAFGLDGEYQVSNRNALDFFEEALEISRTKVRDRYRKAKYNQEDTDLMYKYGI